MKIIFIGDTHGMDTWKDIVAKETDADKVIFGGDYLDSFTIKSEAIHANFLDILQFKRDNPDKVVLMLGNHCYSYLPYGQHCSGFRPETKACLSHILDEAVRKGEIKACHKEGDILFSHAGVSKTWCADYGIEVNDSIADQINELFIYNHSAFAFQHKSFRQSCYGDDTFQSPLWVRPYSLEKDKIDKYFQVVGHSPQKTIKIENGIAFCDTLEHGDGSYLVIEDYEFNINYL